MSKFHLSSALVETVIGLHIMPMHSADHALARWVNRSLNFFQCLIAPSLSL